MWEISKKEIQELIGSTIGKYKIIEYMASGSFSAVFKVQEIYSSEQMVAKLELTAANHPPFLSREFMFYQKLRYECKSDAIPRVYYFGEISQYHALVIQMLGPSLTDKYREFGRKFSERTVILLAIQMIDIFQYIHSRRIIFRDVKPDNFLFGLPKTDSEKRLHLIDFGLAKEYKDASGQHIPFSENAGATGTLRYMSINANLGRQQSRRDDLEAIAYVLIYLLRGSMPWSGVSTRDPEKMMLTVAEIKQNTKPEDLCSGIPQEFCSFLITVRSMDFEEEPKYTDLIDSFKKLFEIRFGQNSDKTIDWNDIHKKDRTDSNSDRNDNNGSQTVSDKQTNKSAD